MREQFYIEWIDHGREPRVAPDPHYPDGIDLDMANGKTPSCSVALPYPAARCGLYVVKCRFCFIRVACTTAGRPDDPRSIRIACKQMARQ